MKRKIFATLSLILSVGLFVTFTNCNSGSKDKTKTTVSGVKATNELIQGFFELTPPFQGYAEYLDNHFLFLIGMSDSTMFSVGGKYEISEDTITEIPLFSTDPDFVGNTRWTAEMLEGDTLKATIFNKDGSISGFAKMVKKVNPTEEMRSQMTDIEGFFQYLPPSQGLSINIAGYYIFLYGQSDDTMFANAGTYKNVNDTITCKYLFSTDPQLVGGEFRWINPSIVVDTFTFAVLDDMGEVTGTGQCERIN